MSCNFYDYVVNYATVVQYFQLCAKKLQLQLLQSYKCQFHLLKYTQGSYMQPFNPNVHFPSQNHCNKLTCFFIVLKWVLQFPKALGYRFRSCINLLARFPCFPVQRNAKQWYIILSYFILSSFTQKGNELSAIQHQSAIVISQII